MRGRRREEEQEDRVERRKGRGKSQSGCGESMRKLSQLIELRKIYKVLREC